MSASQLPSYQRPSNTKIVATIGPACGKQRCLADLIAAGVDIFRINTAHGTRQQRQQYLDDIRNTQREAGRPIGVLVDLAGPKIRLGELPGGQVRCAVGDQVRFIRGESSTTPGELVTNYAPLIDELAVGDRVMLADGTVGMIVEECGKEYAKCRVVQPGVIRNRQGVNLPGVKLSIPSLSQIDRENAAWAAQNGVDFVGLSFVRRADEIRQLQALLQSNGSESQASDSQTSGAQVIAKIEKPEALDHLEQIIEAADGVMVARGDLGVETDIAQMAVAQKQIVAACNRARKPVIIATQMLDSMQHSRLPTRAEVTDVANAILDGADACMLSGETAIGQYPVQTVEMMHRIALATEPLYRQRPPVPQPDVEEVGDNPITEAIVRAGGQLAEQLDAKMVVVSSASGLTALSLSKYRNFVPTIGVSRSEATLQRMCLYWGVIPLAGAPTEDNSQLLEYVTNWGQKVGGLSSGDLIVLIAGTGLSASAHNMVVVHQLD